MIDMIVSIEPCQCACVELSLEGCDVTKASERILRESWSITSCNLGAGFMATTRSTSCRQSLPTGHVGYSSEGILKKQWVKGNMPGRNRCGRTLDTNQNQRSSVFSSQETIGHRGYNSQNPERFYRGLPDDAWC